MKSLYESLQNRDAATWDEFYEQHVRELYGFVFRLVRGDPQTAADVFQDTWLDAISHIGQFDPKRGELRSWLFGIARRRVALHWRQRLAHGGMAAAARVEAPVEVLDGAVVPDDVIEHLEQAAVVQATLLALPRSSSASSFHLSPVGRGVANRTPFVPRTATTARRLAAASQNSGREDGNATCGAARQATWVDRTRPYSCQAPGLDSDLGLWYKPVCVKS